MRTFRSRASWVGLSAAALVISATGVALAAETGHHHVTRLHAATAHARRRPAPFLSSAPSPALTPLAPAHTRASSPPPTLVPSPWPVASLRVGTASGTVRCARA